MDTSSPGFLGGESDLVNIFRGAEKPREQFRIGAEAEKFGVDRATGAPLHYTDESGRSVQTILHALIDRHGWTAEPESPGGPLIALRRGSASVTLEPGGQLELSGAPLEDVHKICAEARGHLAEIRDISAELGVIWLGVGFHPFARQADLDWVPKARYGIMKVFLPSRGAYGLDMMRRTSTVQANYDFHGEADAMRKLRVSLRLAPLTTAMFANSPFYEGKQWGGKSYRAKVWLDVAPDRQGLVPGVLHEGSRYSDYVAWALDASMFMIKRDGRALENTGQTFRSFLRHGFSGHRATALDWETHLNTLFPEVRLKRPIEVRGSDSLPADLACALPALWTGIFYDDRALAEADALSADFTHDELLALREQVPERALGATFRGKPLADLAQRVLEVAEGGLERRARLGRDGRDERVHLSRLRALVERGRCPADDLISGLDESSGDFTREMLRRARIS
jgi:glutamate--cysteine ligase